MGSILFAAAVLVAAAATPTHAESKVSCDTVPAAVLAHVKSEAPDATIHGCVKDKENGKVVYEVETLTNNKSKDMTFDASGNVIEVEQEVDRASLPPAVSSAIMRVAKGSEVGKVESVTRGGTIASYETTLMQHGRKHEVAFSPDGNPMKAD